MVRLAKFNEDIFITAAIEIVAHCGVSAVSISAIANKTGAPVGSVYHRFESRDTILAKAWLRVKKDFRSTVASKWAAKDTWHAVACFLAWCRTNPVHAKFLLRCENYPVFSETLSPDLHGQLESEQAALDACFAQCARIASREPVNENIDAMLRFILIDSPTAIVRPYLMQNLPIPDAIDTMLRASHDAVCHWATSTT